MSHAWERKLKPGKRGYVAFNVCGKYSKIKTTEFDGRRWVTLYEDKSSGLVSKHAGQCPAGSIDPAQLTLPI